MRTALGLAKNRLTRTLIPHKLALSNFTQESRTPVELLLCSELRMYVFLSVSQPSEAYNLLQET